MRFHSIVQLGGKTATGIPIPEEVVSNLGPSKRPPVRVTINGHTYRSTVASRGGEFVLPISAQNREGAGVVAGDEVDVDIQLDTEPREVAVPSDFAEALDRDEDAKRSFDGLSYSQKRRHVPSLDRGRQDERDPSATHRQGGRRAAGGPDLVLGGARVLCIPKVRPRTKPRRRRSGSPGGPTLSPVRSRTCRARC
jgi:hypothetical protein